MTDRKIPGGAIGLPISRVEAVAKVTGKAQYAAEYALKDIAYGVLVTSTITKGCITVINSQVAEQLPGVLAVVSHLNRPEVPGYHEKSGQPIPIFYGQPFRLFYDDQVYHNQQPVALVIAETLEQAQYAATLIQISYQESNFNTDIYNGLSAAFTPANSANYQRGKEGAWEKSPVKM